MNKIQRARVAEAASAREIANTELIVFLENGKLEPWAIAK